MNLDPISIIYRSCDPDLPLPLEDKRYVSLADGRGETPLSGLSWRDQLARDIRRSERPDDVPGRRVCRRRKVHGIPRLQHDLKTDEAKLAAVYVDTSSLLNPYEYSFTDVLLAIVTQTARQLQAEYGIQLRPSYWKRRMDEVRRTLLSDVEFKQLEAKGDAGPFGISGTLALKARDSDQVRKQLWHELSTEKTTLVREFHDLLDQQARTKIRQQGYQDLVLIVDWLEKLQPARRDTEADPYEALFLLNAGLFQSLGVHLVLTLPLSMAYSATQQRLTLAYNRTPILINAVRVAKLFPAAQRNVGRQALLNLLEQRFLHAPEGRVKFADVFPDRGLAEQVVEFSGGHPRTLLILLRECCSFRDSLPITPEAFAGAKRKMVEAVSRQVREEWYEPLADVHLTHRIKNDAEHQRMLLNLCILSYSNGEPLYDVVPPITELKRFQETLRAKSRGRRVAGNRPAPRRNDRVEAMPPDADSTTVSETTRLVRHLQRARGQFSLAFVRWNHPGEEADVAAQLRAQCPELRIAEVRLADRREAVQPLYTLQAALERSPAPDVLFIYGLEKAFPAVDEPAGGPLPVLVSLNLQRDSYRQSLPAALVFWTPDWVLDAIAGGAPDFWSWRSGVFAFDLPAGAGDALLAEAQRLLAPPAEEIRQRIEGLRKLWHDLGDGEGPSPHQREQAIQIAATLSGLYGRMGDQAEADRWAEVGSRLAAPRPAQEQPARSPKPTTVRLLRSLRFLARRRGGGAPRAGRGGRAHQPHGRPGPGRAAGIVEMGRRRRAADRAAAAGRRRRPDARRLRRVPGHSGPPLRHAHGPLRIGHREGVPRRPAPLGPNRQALDPVLLQDRQGRSGPARFRPVRQGPQVPRSDPEEGAVRHLRPGARLGRRVLRASGHAPAERDPGDRTAPRKRQPRRRRRKPQKTAPKPGVPRAVPAVAAAAVRQRRPAGPGTQGRPRAAAEPGVRAADDLGGRTSQQGKKQRRPEPALDPEQREKPQLLLDLLDKQSLYVSGDPGSGKSTFCRWTGWLCGEGELPNHQVEAADEYRERFPESLRGRLPILVRLRDFFAHLPRETHRDDLARGPFEQSLRRWLEKSEPDGLDWETVQWHLEQGTALLVFDGVDEVPISQTDATGDWHPRAMLLSGLAEAGAAWMRAGNRLLVTSRPYGLRDADRQRLGLPHAPIQDLSPPLQDLLVRRWFHILVEPVEAAEAVRPGHAPARPRARGTGSAGHQSHAADGHVHPVQRRQAAAAGQARSVRADRGQRAVQPLPGPGHDRQGPQSAVRGGLRHAHRRGAWARTAARRRPRVTFDEINRMLEAYRQQRRYTDAGFQDLVECREQLLSQTGLLLPRGPEQASFYHLSIQEFLAAQRVWDLDSDKLADVFRRRAAVPEWHNTLSVRVRGPVGQEFRPGPQHPAGRNADRRGPARRTRPADRAGRVPGHAAGQEDPLAGARRRNSASCAWTRSGAKCRSASASGWA